MRVLACRAWTLIAEANNCCLHIVGIACMAMTRMLKGAGQGEPILEDRLRMPQELALKENKPCIRRQGSALN